ncbi:hypothetical protein [Streptomyces sp. NPDC059452]|uniref:hypothetical protein n=1 Tax=Streptomyces sp. NPDC059452 TaxID=3346835 RepID=UPI0036B98FD3
MPTYYEVMQTDLSKLTAAAGKWEAMAGEFKKLEDQYKRDIHGVTVVGSWAGLSARAAKERFDVTLREIQAAQKEAKAIGSLLRDAYTQFVNLRGKVQAARADAIEAGMKVSDQGAVFFDTERLSPSNRIAYHHDPSYQESGRVEANKWAQVIDRAVKAVADADDGVRIALNAVVVDTDLLDGTTNGFNANAEGDIEKYELDQMMEIASRINSGTATAQDLKDAERSLRDNSGNKFYSQTLLNSWGADQTIQFTNKLNDLAYFDDKKDKAAYLRIQGGLSDVLATATRVPDFGKGGNPLPAGSKEKPLALGTKGYAEAVQNWRSTKDADFYNNWLDGLRKVGAREYDTKVVDELTPLARSDDKARGYQSLVTLMQTGGDYSGYFLHDLADDIRRAEDPGQKGDSNIWDLGVKYDSGHQGKGGGWFANDPLDGLLGIMSNDPDTATAYFDSKAYQFDNEAESGAGAVTQPGKDRLAYLQTGRDWEIIGDQTRSFKDDVSFQVPVSEDTDSRVGFGKALEAAATGYVPGTTDVTRDYINHSDAQIRIFEGMVNHYSEAGKSGQGSAVPENMRENFGNVIAYYPGDVYQILSKNVDFSGPGFSTHPNGVDVDSGAMVRFIREVSEDGGAFKTVHGSQMAFAAREIEELSHGDLSRNPEGGSPDKAKGTVQEAGYVIGALDQVRADVLIDQRDAQISDNNWAKAYKYHVYGAPVTGLPFFGDTLQRMIDLGTGKEAEALNGVVENSTREDLIDKYQKDGYPRLQNMLNEQAKSVGVTSGEILEKGSRMSQVHKEARSSYGDGLNGVDGATGERG